jgi:hypothetical protein
MGALAHGSSPPFPRFYKLHERKCEPIVMTVPRKVRPPGSLAHLLPSVAGDPHRVAGVWLVNGYGWCAAQMPVCPGTSPGVPWMAQGKLRPYRSHRTEEAK